MKRILNIFCILELSFFNLKVIVNFRLGLSKKEKKKQLYILDWSIQKTNRKKKIILN